jgi:hypothetical protein
LEKNLKPTKARYVTTFLKFSDPINHFPNYTYKIYINPGVSSSQDKNLKIDIIMEEKKETFFDSLWFNAIMSIVAVVVLAEKVINQSYIMIIIWLVIAYHFITATMKKR